MHSVNTNCIFSHPTKQIFEITLFCREIANITEYNSTTELKWGYIQGIAKLMGLNCQFPFAGIFVRNLSIFSSRVGPCMF